MKKQYIKPIMEVVRFNNHITLLSGSPLGVNPGSSGSQSGAEGKWRGDFEIEDDFNFFYRN